MNIIKYIYGFILFVFFSFNPIIQDCAAKQSPTKSQVNSITGNRFTQKKKAQLKKRYTNGRNIINRSQHVVRVSNDSLAHNDSILFSIIALAEDDIKSLINECRKDYKYLAKSKQLDFFSSQLESLQCAIWTNIVILILVAALLLIISIFLIRYINRSLKHLSRTQDVNLFDDVENKEAINSTLDTPHVSEKRDENFQILSESDIIAYNDAVQAFVNINDYFYELRRYKDELSPCLNWLLNITDIKPSVISEEFDEELRSKISLFVSKIETFKNIFEPAINRYLLCTQKDFTFNDCVRYPLNSGFDSELDQHCLGEELNNGEIIHGVLKLGFYFPDSKSYPYRVKSIIL